MRILIVTDYFQPIIGYAKVQIARSLTKQGHEIRFLTSNRYFPFRNYKVTVEKIIGSRVRKIGSCIENNFRVERKKVLLEFWSRVLFLGYEKTIIKFKPELVIVFGISSFSAIQVARLKNKYKFKLIMADSHLPSEFNLGNQHLKRILYFLFRTFFNQSIIKNTDKFIALQDKTKWVIKNVYGVKNRKISLVPNGTDCNLFKFEAKARAKIRKKLKLGSQDFVIIYTGKIIKQKGIHILTQAVGKLIKKYSNIYLLLVGDGPANYKKLCLKNLDRKVKSKIIWIGFQDQKNLYQYYSASDVAVWPLQGSLAMNDAAACSLPFIANHTMGDKIRISNNNALLYQKGNVQDLAVKINFLYKNKKTRLKMGGRGRKLVEKKLTWDKIAKQYLKI